MVRAFGLIVLALLLVRCAQVGVLTGGEKDIFAPMEVQSNPPNSSKQVFPQQIELTFDEFIQLNATPATIRMVPPDGKVSARLSKKTVTLSIEGTLQQNTTYSIVMNGAIKDVTEGNDSIYSFVFSTGMALDSLKSFIVVSDAFQHKLLKEVTVGLYDSDTATYPRYLGVSNAKGQVVLSNLPDRKFYVKAMVDLNKNGIIDFTEKQGQVFESISMKDSDTVFIELSVPRDTVTINQLKIDPPGILYAHVPNEIDLTKITLNENLFKAFRINRDSIGISLGKQSPRTLSLMHEDQKLDKLYSAKESTTNINIQVSGFNHHGVVELRCSDFISSLLEKELWKLQTLTDSISVPIDSIRMKDNRVLIYANQLPQGQLKLIVPKGAIKGVTGNQNEKKTIDFVHYREENLGRITINLPPYDGSRILILEKDGKEVAASRLRYGSMVIFKDLLPGEYQLVVVQDKNNNGYWDPLDPVLHRQAEPIKRYSKFPKIRMNWDMEFSLEED